MIASVPVLHALEFAVTWLPRASSPETRAETPLPMTCSTIVLPRRRTRPSSTMGTTRSPMVSMPPMPVPITAPVSQWTRSSSCKGRSKPASVQASTAAMQPKRWLEFMASSSSSSKYCSAISSTPWGTPATRQPNFNSSRMGMWRIPDVPFRRACS